MGDARWVLFLITHHLSPITRFRHLLLIVVDDLGDNRKGNLHNLAVRALDLDAGCRQCLGRLHTSHGAAYAASVRHYNLYIVFPIEGAQGCEGFCYFHLGYRAFLLIMWSKTHYTVVSPNSEPSETANKMQPPQFLRRIAPLDQRNPLAPRLAQ